MKITKEKIESLNEKSKRLRQFAITFEYKGNIHTDVFFGFNKDAAIDNLLIKYPDSKINHIHEDVP